MILQQNARENGKATVILGKYVIATLWKRKGGVIIKAERLCTIAELEQIITITKEWNA